MWVTADDDFYSDPKRVMVSLLVAMLWLVWRGKKLGRQPW